ncbi:cytochrome P450 [Nonomuraea thailandensis]|uniref:Cytochrome P450 n=1 Tax=Nonomuraea thailandensis TaxID=1188745 RepID=A0A9X2GWY2_9ACTN|nr:cytochrome P450 [Nonomuraea thailandensis]MCP2365465.1 cytochrome P450 [Nonomuraea thailandensis]
MTTRDDAILVGTPDFKADAHARYAELRERGPIHRVRSADGSAVWLVVEYELGREALAHPKLSKDPEPFAERLRAAGQHIMLAGSGFGGNMLTADPPEHTRLRRLASKAFTAGAAERLAPRIEQLSHRLVDAFASTGADTIASTGADTFTSTGADTIASADDGDAFASAGADAFLTGQADLVASFTRPLPMAVICELLGVPEERRADLQRWTREGMSSPSERQRAALLSLNSCLRGLLADKRRAPAGDLLSELIRVHDDDHGRLSDTELLGTAVLLVVAGHETTVNLLGNALAALLDHPEQAARLRARPELIPGAVEEFLRYDAPVETTPARFATEDLTLGGQHIRAGQAVAVALTSASRDALPPDEAGRLDVTRSEPRHLAFGHGIHYCLGAPLARVEAAVGLRVLLSRLPELAWADPSAEVRRLPAGITRGPVALPVRFTASVIHRAVPGETTTNG